MTRSAVSLLVALLTMVAAGCRTAPRKDLVEAELRVKDRDLRDLRSELERTESYNQYLQREMRALQGLTPHQPGSDAVSSNRVKSISLARQTGGIDDDGKPGDEALQVVLEPRDSDNHSVKAPGTAVVQALEITAEGVKKPLSSWHVDAETLRKSWRSGLLGSGYTLTLPWRVWPSIAKIRVTAQFVSEDGRLFEAERDVIVRLAPGAERGNVVPEPPTPPPPMPKVGDVLPAPREVEPEKKQEGPSLTPISTGGDPTRPLKGAVEILRPVPLR